MLGSSVKPILIRRTRTKRTLIPLWPLAHTDGSVVNGVWQMFNNGIICQLITLHCGVFSLLSCDCIIFLPYPVSFQKGFLRHPIETYSASE